MGFMDRLFGRKKDDRMKMQMKTISCPNCNSPMGMTEVDGKMVILCNNCGHFFMERGGFQDMVGEELHEHDREHGEPVTCPNCKGGMKVAEVQDEEIDVCSKCGKVHTSREAILHIHDGHERGHEESAGAPDAENAAAEPDDKTIMGFIFKMDRQRNIQRASSSQKIEGLKIGSLFVIHQDGLLITSYTSDDGGIDRDIIGGMIVAITDFVRTSFDSFRDDEPLSSIRFREKEIAFEHGKYLILAMELEGSLDAGARAAISERLQEIEGKYDGVLAAWNGDMRDVESLVSEFRSILMPLKN